MPDFEALWNTQRSYVERLARRVATVFGAYSMLNDLVSVGQIALWQVCQDYEPKRGVSLWAYAYLRVRGAMIDEIRKWDHVGRQGRHTIRDLGEEFVEPWALLHPCELMYASNVPANGNPDSELEKQETNMQLLRLLKELSTVEQLVIQRTFYENRKLLEVGKELGLTESRVCQIRKLAINKLKNNGHWHNSCDR